MPKLINAIGSYQKKLEAAEKSTTATIEIVAGILMARDQVQLTLDGGTMDSSVQMVKLADLDVRLKKLVQKYEEVPQVTVLRDSRSASSSAWWWHLGWGQKRTRMTSVLNGLTSLLAVIILGLILDIAPRFMGGGSDTWGIVVIGLQSLITLFAANTLFNREGNGLIDVLLSNTNIPTKTLPVARTGIALLVVVVLFLFRSFLPAWSRWDNIQGFKFRERGELQIAEAYFTRAIRLNNNNYQAHYNLGELFDTLGDYGQARGEYTIAAMSGHDLAYNNLGRLLLLQGEYIQAVQITKEGLKKAEDPAVQYYLNKNLGWVRLKQERSKDAITALQEALIHAHSAGLSGVEAHCLLAQAFEMQGNPVESKNEWYQCKAQASAQDLIKSPEMDEWQYLADKHLTP